MSVLDDIIRQKRVEVVEAQQAVPLSQLQTEAARQSPPTDFVEALRKAHPMGLIAEVKKASPSAGIIRADFDPIRIAEAYVAGGAACLSVLTDVKFFQGSLEFLRGVRSAVSVPLLRKDFIIDPYQVWEARAAGADSLLLIAECLDDETLAGLYQQSLQLGMQPLVEVYEPQNLARVLALNPPLVGINNRDLHTFTTDLQHTTRLREQIPGDVLVVGESGIRTAEDVQFLQSRGVHAILVGESLMRCPNVTEAVRALLSGRGE